METMNVRYFNLVLKRVNDYHSPSIVSDCPCGIKKKASFEKELQSLKIHSQDLFVVLVAWSTFKLDSAFICDGSTDLLQGGLVVDVMVCHFSVVAEKDNSVITLKFHSIYH